MSEKRITLFELHTDSVQIGPETLGAGEADGPAPDTGTTDDIEFPDEGADGDERGTGLALLAVLGLLVLAAIALKKLGGSEAGTEELELLDDLSEELEDGE